MVQKKFHRNNEFSITVSYKRRNQRYKVRHQALNNEEEKFCIIATNRIVELTSKREPSDREVLLGYKQVYTYDDHDITNKSLMKRIIEAIDKHMSVGV